MTDPQASSAAIMVKFYDANGTHNPNFSGQLSDHRTHFSVTIDGDSSKVLTAKLYVDLKAATSAETQKPFTCQMGTTTTVGVSGSNVYQFQVNQLYTLKCVVALNEPGFNTLWGRFSVSGAPETQSYTYRYQTAINTFASAVVTNPNDIQYNSTIKISAPFDYSINPIDTRKPSHVLFTFDVLELADDNTEAIQSYRPVLSYREDGLDYVLLSNKLASGRYLCSLTAVYDDGFTVDKVVQNPIRVASSSVIKSIVPYGLGEEYSGAGDPQISSVMDVTLDEELGGDPTIVFKLSQGNTTYYVYQLPAKSVPEPTYYVDKTHLISSQNLASIVQSTADNGKKYYRFNVTAERVYDGAIKKSAPVSADFTLDITAITSVQLLNQWVAVAVDLTTNAVELDTELTQAKWDSISETGYAAKFSKTPFFGSEVELGLYKDLDTTSTKFKIELSSNGGAFEPATSVRMKQGSSTASSPDVDKSQWLSLLDSTLLSNPAGIYDNIPWTGSPMSGQTQPPIYLIGNCPQDASLVIKVTILAQDTTLPDGTTSNQVKISNKVDTPELQPVFYSIAYDTVVVSVDDDFATSNDKLTAVKFTSNLDAPSDVKVVDNPKFNRFINNSALALRWLGNPYTKHTAAFILPDYTMVARPGDRGGIEFSVHLPKGAGITNVAGGDVRWVVHYKFQKKVNSVFEDVFHVYGFRVGYENNVYFRRAPLSNSWTKSSVANGELVYATFTDFGISVGDTFRAVAEMNSMESTSYHISGPGTEKYSKEFTYGISDNSTSPSRNTFTFQVPSVDSDKRGPLAPVEFQIKHIITDTIYSNAVTDITGLQGPLTSVVCYNKPSIANFDISNIERKIVNDDDVSEFSFDVAFNNDNNAPIKGMRAYFSSNSVTRVAVKDVMLADQAARVDITLSDEEFYNDWEDLTEGRLDFVPLYDDFELDGTAVVREVPSEEKTYNIDKVEKITSTAVVLNGGFVEADTTLQWAGTSASNYKITKNGSPLSSSDIVSTGTRLFYTFPANTFTVGQVVRITITKIATVSATTGTEPDGPSTVIMFTAVSVNTTQMAVTVKRDSDHTQLRASFQAATFSHPSLKRVTLQQLCHDSQPITFISGTTSTDRVQAPSVDNLYNLADYELGDLLNLKMVLEASVYYTSKVGSENITSELSGSVVLPVLPAGPQIQYRVAGKPDITGAQATSFTVENNTISIPVCIHANGSTVEGMSSITVIIAQPSDFTDATTTNVGEGATLVATFTPAAATKTYNVGPNASADDATDHLAAGEIRVVSPEDLSNGVHAVESGEITLTLGDLSINDISVVSCPTTRFNTTKNITVMFIGANRLGSAVFVYTYPPAVVA